MRPLPLRPANLAVELREGSETGRLLTAFRDRNIALNGGRQWWVQSLVAATYKAGVLADSPASYWRLGESTGTSAADSAGTNAGTYTGGVTLGQAGALVGDSDTAALFDGSTGYVSVPYSASFNFTTSLTVEAWIKTTSTQSYICQNSEDSFYFDVGAGGAANGALSFYLNTSSGGSGWVFTQGLVSNGAWHHAVATWDGATIRLYVDGALVTNQNGATTYAWGGTLNAASHPILIARRGAVPAQSFNGTIDEVAIYPTALSAARIAEHYRLGRFLYLPPSAIHVGTGSAAPSATDTALQYPVLAKNLGGGSAIGASGYTARLYFLLGTAEASGITAYEAMLAQGSGTGGAGGTPGYCFAKALLNGGTGFFHPTGTVALFAWDLVAVTGS